MRHHETVHAWQADIEQDKIRTKVFELGETRRPVIHQLDVMAVGTQQRAHGFRRIDIVFDDQDPTRAHRRPFLRDLWRGNSRQWQRSRQDDAELTALAQSCAVRFDSAAVHLDQQFDDGESHAEPALRTIERAIALQEQVEQMRKQLRIDACARVAYFDDRIDSGAIDHDLDARAFRGILAGVGEQVRHHLAKPQAVALDEYLLARLAHQYRLAPRVQHRLHGFQSGIHHGVEAQRLAMQRHPAPGDTRHIEEIVHEMRS